MIDSAIAFIANINIHPMVTLGCACMCAYLIGSIPGKPQPVADDALAASESEQPTPVAENQAAVK